MSRVVADLLPRVTAELSFAIGRWCGEWFDSIQGVDEELERRRPVMSEASVGGEWMSEEEIDYNLMGSFPASDPPSWTLGVRPHKISRYEFEGEKPSPHDPSHQNEPPEESESAD